MEANVRRRTIKQLKIRQFIVYCGSRWTFLDVVVVGEAGLEPTTPGLEGRCSIQLSYSPVPDIVSSAGRRIAATP